MNSSDRLVEPANYSRSTNNRLGIWALAVYCFSALLLISQKPGLQYDEALHVAGAVHMLHGRGEFPLTHDPHSWVSVGQRSFPVMALRYTGAVKDYYCLPFFAALGPRMSVIRIASMLLGMAGIWGLYVLCRDQFGPRIAAAAALVLAINPSYINQTVFDTSAVATWMAALGFVCLALNRYLKHPGPAGAAVLGFTVGFAVWTRANFLWLLGSVALAALFSWGRRLLPPVSHAARMAAGALAGAFPFLAYQVISKGGTWEALDMYPAKGDWLQRIHARLLLLSETLLSDREHRAMWAAAEMPSWQNWLLAGVLLLACVFCLMPRVHADAGRRAWARAAALSFVFLTVIMLTTRLDVSEHHLVVVLPIAAAMVVLGASALWARSRIVKAAIVGLACVYGGLTVSWNQRAYAGLKETGGVGLWSNASIPLTQHIEQSYRGRQIRILDWGFQYNLFVLSSGRVPSREIFWEATEHGIGPGRTWPQVLSDRGVYLLPGDKLRSFPTAAQGFLSTVADEGIPHQQFSVSQRNGEPYATLVEVQGESCSAGTPSPRIITGDPGCNGQLEGFHKIEESGWRWSAKEFAARLGMPARKPANGLRLHLDLYVPDSLIQKFGPLTLTARLGDRVIARQQYRRAGMQKFSAGLEGAALDPHSNTFRFALDKWIDPTPSDPRQLGIVVSAIALAAQ